MQELFTTWVDIVGSGISDSFSAFFAYLPNIVAAVIIFAVGWTVAKIVKRITLKVIDISQLEPFAEKVGITSALKRVGTAFTPSELLGEIVRWAIVLIFLNPTAEILGLSQITVLINNVLLYIPRVIVAALIIMIGIIFADLTAQFVKSTAASLGSGAANALEVITRYAIIIFVFLAALSELGIAETLITTLFTGLVAMIAIAGGLAFGLGGKELASDILQSLRKNLQERTPE